MSVNDIDKQLQKDLDKFVDNNKTGLDDTISDKQVIDSFIDNFNTFINAQEDAGIKLKFTDEVRKYFQCKQTSEGYYFTFGDRTCYLSKRKSKNKAWQEFIKNYWYRDENKSFRIEVYKTIFELADNDDMDITE